MRIYINGLIFIKMNIYNKKTLNFFFLFLNKRQYELYFYVIFQRKRERERGTLKINIYYILKYTITKVSISIFFIWHQISFITFDSTSISILRVRWCTATHVDTQRDCHRWHCDIPAREESHNYGRLLEISRLPRSHIRAGSVIARRDYQHETLSPKVKDGWMTPGKDRWKWDSSRAIEIKLFIKLLSEKL